MKSENAEFLYEDGIISFMTLGRAEKQVWFLRSQPSGSDWTMFLKTKVLFSKNHDGAHTISLSLSLSTTYALHNTILSICQVTMSFPNASVSRPTIPVAGRHCCIDNATNSLLSAELTQVCAFSCLFILLDYLFFMIMWGKNIGGMQSKTEIPAATVLIPFWTHWFLSKRSHCHRMWSLNVWRSFLSL